VAQERMTLTVAEAARILGIGRSSCYEAVQRGEIRSVTIGRRRLVPKWVIDELLATPPTAAQPDRGRIAAVTTSMPTRNR
jgi:excisionase family DNA binding protein